MKKTESREKGGTNINYMKEEGGNSVPRPTRSETQGGGTYGKKTQIGGPEKGKGKKGRAIKKENYWKGRSKKGTT